jgi:hypothetical protein
MIRWIYIRNIIFSLTVVQIFYEDKAKPKTIHDGFPSTTFLCFADLVTKEKSELVRQHVPDDVILKMPT